MNKWNQQQVLPAKYDKHIFFNFLQQVGALDYQGSDKVWAGMVSRISTAVDKAIGRWSVRLFRMWHFRPARHLGPLLAEIPKNKKGPKGRFRASNPRWKMFTPSPFKAYVLQIIFVLLVLTLGILIVLWGLPDFSSQDDKKTGSFVTSGLAIGIAIASLTQIMALFSIV